MNHNSYIESKKTLDALRGKNEVMFRMAISHLMDVGIRHLDDETVAATVEAIKLEDDTHSFMTNNFKIQLIYLAAKLAKIDHIHLLAYISHEVWYDVMDGSPCYSRMDNLIKSTIEYDDGFLSGSDLYERLNSIGYSDDEITYFGYDHIIPENYVRDDD